MRLKLVLVRHLVQKIDDLNTELKAAKNRLGLYEDEWNPRCDMGTDSAALVSQSFGEVITSNKIDWYLSSIGIPNYLIT